MNMYKYHWTERDRGDGILELDFEELVNQEDDEPLNAVNAEIYETYGEGVTIDWRDEYTCWVHLREGV